MRGRDLIGDLMGRLTFTEYFHLLLTGDEPTEDAAVLPRPSAGRDRRARAHAVERRGADDARGGPRSAAGRGRRRAPRRGPRVLGTSRRVRAPARIRRASPVELARGIHAAGGKVPGFGHPLHKPVDPRAERILALADERGVSGGNVARARALRDAVAELWDKPLPLNVAMAIAAVLLDLGYTADAVKAVPILARTAGLLAHLAEERELPIGLHLGRVAEDAVEYE